MRLVFITILGLISCLGVHPLVGEDVPADTHSQHREGSTKLGDEQDELSADVQQLIIEQTVPQVIKLLEEVEEIMDEATDRLVNADTGGKTMAAQTEIIEKIHAAAKERQNQNGSGKSGGAMMDMMERMMGKKEKEGSGKPGQKPGDQSGQGSGGESDTANNQTDSDGSDDTGESRRVPKAAGTAGRNIPEEFKNAFDAYNRGVERKLK